MNRLVCLLLLIFFGGVATAQNLVPNANFALYNSCPTGLGQLDKCTYWYNPTSATPDYLNACHDTLTGSTHWVGVPNNLMGTQASVTNSYIGIATIQAPTYREYAGIVIPALALDTAYRVLLKISLADNAFWATEAPSVFFFKDLDTFNSILSALPYTPQVEFSYAGHISEKTNWVTVIDTFIADSAYTHMLIGNFHDVASTTYTTLPGAGVTNYCLFYIDSVAVEKIVGFTSVVNTNADVHVRLSPNPVVDRAVLTVDGLQNTSSYTLSIMNMQGQVVRRIDNIRTGTMVIDCDALATGFYYCRLYRDDGVVWQDKMVVQLQ